MNSVIVKPKRLTHGDTIGFIAPASRPEDMSRVEKAAAYFRGQGYEVKTGSHLGERRGYLAGTDAQRVADITQMFEDRDVHAIFCVRGGYGAPRLLPALPYQLIHDNPKIFVGYSDITSLHSAFFSQSSLVTFAGPMPAVDFWNETVPYTAGCLWDIISGRNDEYLYPMPPDHSMATVVEGKASGRIVGGNLAVFCGILGSKYVPDLKNKILYLEDVDEQPYRLDRMFNQLKLSGMLDEVKGIILGQFTDCVPADSTKPTLSFEDIIGDYFGGLKIPVMMNFPHGHVKQNAAIPHGILVEMDATNGTLKLLEPAVV